MIELGCRQRLQVVKKVEFGVYLAETEDTEMKVLLPAKQVPPAAEVGDSLEVFIYKDSKDRIIATTKQPLLEMGQTAVLKVVETGKIGAFLDWGLEKDLLLPFKEQTTRVAAEKEYLVTLYIDKSQRLCATMKVYDYLRTDSPYQKDEMVRGIVYETSEEFGVFVAVDNQYSGLIPRREGNPQLRPGDVVEARVTAVKPDGKLDLSVRQKAHLQMAEDAQRVLSVIEEFAGVLPFNDKAAPEVIQREFGMSKGAFKRAVGKLLKEGYIEITERSIRKRG